MNDILILICSITVIVTLLESRVCRDVYFAEVVKVDHCLICVFNNGKKKLLKYVNFVVKHDL